MNAQTPVERPLWGAAAIGKFIGLNPRQATYLLDRGELPGVKVGGRWIAFPSRLLKTLDAPTKDRP